MLCARMTGSPLGHDHPLRAAPVHVVPVIARVIVVRLVVLQGERVVVVGAADVEAVAGALLGQPLAVPVELELVAVGVLVVNGVPAQRVGEPGRVLLPARADEDPADPFRDAGQRQVRTRIGPRARRRIEEQEIQDRDVRIAASRTTSGREGRRRRRAAGASGPSGSPPGGRCCRSGHRSGRARRSRPMKSGDQ